ncbi:MAG: hypothetical protein ACQETH_15630 [Candidatus Rifleibacteriota bacterium]
MYSKRAGLILGFHGCDKSVRDKVVSKKGIVLEPSENNYDWLGNGIYFWENNYERALQYAKDIKKNPQRNCRPIAKPSVIGAVIDLGHCLDLLDSEYLNLLKEGYNLLKKIKESHDLPIPKNKPIVKEGDLLLRHLDCAVIETIHQFNKDKALPEFDSVRGVFFEGQDLYPNAGFKEKNHIQISVRNINCIKGFFIPRKLDPKLPKP